VLDGAEHRPPGRAVDARGLIIGVGDRLQAGIAQQRADIGLLGAFLNRLGLDYNYAGNALAAWSTIVVMDVWHWTSLVALLCYAGLKSIPDAYYPHCRHSCSRVRAG
jgi:hypothetical protein